MSSISDKATAASTESAPPNHQNQDPAHSNWRESLMDLVASRVALFQLESKDASEAAAKRAVCIAAAGACVFFAWALLLVGLISILADATSWPWNRFALGLAALHIVIGIVLAKSAKSSGNPAFPVTRAEFQKDREWIENFSKDKKSSD